MKVVCCQLDIVWEDRPANHRRVESLLTPETAPPGSLVVLPEMFASGFSMNVAAIHDAAPGETAAFLSGLAARLGCFVLGGLVTLDPDARGRNQAVAFAPDGGEVARYSKMQPFALGGEGKHYTAGQEIVTFRWQEAVVAPFVCYDLRFPELFRVAAQRGAQIFAVIANWPAVRIQHWITLLQARAIENQAYVIGVNRCGHDLKLAYPGRSLVVNPHGDILADAGTEETVFSADLDLKALHQWRSDFPALPDMRRVELK